MSDTDTIRRKYRAHLFNVCVLSGMDTDGARSVDDMGAVDIGLLAERAVRDLRADYDQSCESEVAALAENERLREALDAAVWLGELRPFTTYECGHGATAAMACPESCEAHAKIVLVAAAVPEERG